MTMSPSLRITDGSRDFGPVNNQETDLESNTEEPSTLAVQLMRGPTPHHTSDQHAPVRVTCS